MEGRRLEIQTGLGGAEPEQVLVLEAATEVTDFLKAASRIRGLDLLGEIEDEDVPPDADFFRRSSPEKPLTSVVYLVMTNQRALTEILSLWNRFQENPQARFDRGYAPIRNLFLLLRDIRVWGPEDRLRETGVIPDWSERLLHGETEVPVELELWYRSDARERARSEAEVRSLVADFAGIIVTRAVIDEIRYHALLVQVSAALASRIIEESSAVRLARADAIMFFRPVGQSVEVNSEETALDAEILDNRPTGSPIAALLDGLPLERHVHLDDQLVVDDPDGWSSDYQASERVHGTAMSSLILNGDLEGDRAPLGSRLYVRPVMKPDERDWRVTRHESFPHDELAVDLTHRAIKRIFEGDAGEGPAAASVRIINFSVADPYSPFHSAISPWARLLDWAAWRYNVLIINACGNCWDPIRLNYSESEIRALLPDELERRVLLAIADGSHDRRLLSPAESVNSLTVGAGVVELDDSTNDGIRTDALITPGLPTAFSRLGLGYRRGIKPDLLMDGGRQLYVARSVTHSETDLEPVRHPLTPPGHRVAAPRTGPSGSTGTWYSTGTSNATALVTRTGVQLYEDVVWPAVLAGDLDESSVPVVLKALLAHGCDWGSAGPVLQDVMRANVDSRRLREYLCRYLGYGLLDPNSIKTSSMQRATMVGAGQLGDGTSASFRIPLPPSLSGQREWRRLTVTLAWFTPSNARDKRYRRARLWFQPPGDELRIERKQAEARAVRRGTLQHEVLEGQRATAYSDGDALRVQVNCAAHAGSLEDDVHFGLAVSLQVGASVAIPVFDEVRARLRPPVRITRPRVR